MGRTLPIAVATDRRYTRARARLTERMADRTGRRQPLLPVLVEYVGERRRHHEALLAAASGATQDSTFEFAVVRLHRLSAHPCRSGRRSPVT